MAGFNFTSHALKALQAAHEEAQRLHSSSVGVQHLLLALGSRSQPARGLPLQLGTDLSQLRSAVQRAALPTSTQRPTCNTATSSEPFSIDPSMKRELAVTAGRCPSIYSLLCWLNPPSLTFSPRRMSMQESYESASCSAWALPMDSFRERAV